MTIYTSYFANARKLHQAGITMIGIALWKPKYFTGSSYYPAAPTAAMLRQKLTTEEYIERYDKWVLSKLSPTQVLKELELLSGGKDIALCCYEKPSDFCHRHLFAKWLTENAGIEVQEYGEEDKPRYVEQSLFE